MSTRGTTPPAPRPTPTTGTAAYTYDGDHLWRGHYASGSAIATWDSRDEIPDGVLAFIASQLVD